jgi:hypothetical protein
LAHPACGRTIRPLDFSAPATDGVTTDPRDLNQSRDTAASPLERQQSRETPPVFFIQTCDDPINRLVLFGHCTIWMLLASLTNTLMNIRFTGLFHARSSFCSSDHEDFTCQFIRYELFAKSSTYFQTKPKLNSPSLHNPLKRS